MSKTQCKLQAIMLYLTGQAGLVIPFITDKYLKVVNKLLNKMVVRGNACS